MERVNLDWVAYTAYQVPDLDLMERFLVDFGMMRSVRTDSALYMRGPATPITSMLRDEAKSPDFWAAHSPSKILRNSKRPPKYPARRPSSPSRIPAADRG